MIENGLFDEMPDACMAMHNDTRLQGVITVASGSISAFSDGCEIIIHGKSTHSSKPETGVDAVQIAACVVTALYQITAKNISPMEPSTLDVGTISGGTADVKFREGYAAVYNDERLSEFVAGLVRENAEALYDGIGEIPDNFLRTGSKMQLGAEDFGFYAQKAPSCFIRVASGDFAPAHNGCFRVDETYIKLFTRVIISSTEWIPNILHGLP